MQKIMLLCCWLMGVLFCQAQQKTPAVAAVLQPVYAQAAKENKKVLLLFGASWCVWCKKMDRSLQHPEVRPLIDSNYIITHLTVYESEAHKDLEHPGALEFLTQQGGADLGIPYWLVLDENGKVLADAQYKPGRNSGCPASEEEVAHFISVLRKTSGLTEPQLQVIGKVFRMNEEKTATAHDRE